MDEKLKAEIEKIIQQHSKRGKDIPADLYDRLLAAASGVTLPIWGRYPTPEQLQWLHDNGHHDPIQIEQAFNALPHPHAPGMTIGEYRDWSHAHQTYEEHRK